MANSSQSSDRVESLAKDLGDLRARIQTIDSYFKAALVIAVFFGIGGGFGALAFSKITSSITTLSGKAEELEKRFEGIDQVLENAKVEIRSTSAAAQKDLADAVPKLLAANGAIRRCRVCYHVVGSDGGNQGGQCGGPVDGCSEWSSSPGWTPAYLDDTDGRPGYCLMRWRLECES